MLSRLHRFVLKALPYRLLAVLGLIIGFFSRRKSFSQYGEDLIVANFFDQIGLKCGSYLDIGAFHPHWISNTKMLHDRGWSGYVVDIDALKLSSFSFVRGGRCQAILGAVGAEERLGGTKAKVYKFKRLLSEIDTLSFEQAQYYSKNWGYEYKEVAVEYLFIGDLLKSVGNVDFLNIDIEGMDEIVLNAIDFTAFRPAVIVFEDNETWGGAEKTKIILAQLGYERLFVSRGSIGYFRKDLIGRASLAR
jgi:hypothetical protein